MKRRMALILALIAVAPAASPAQEAAPGIGGSSNGNAEPSQTIIRAGSHPSAKGAGQHFTGNVHIEPLFPAKEPARIHVLTIALSMVAALDDASANSQETHDMTSTRITTPAANERLAARQQAIVPVAAFEASGDLARLNTALNQGLDAGLTISDAKEILVQLYAYAGFLRSLNALGELMKVVEARASSAAFRMRWEARPAAPFRRGMNCSLPGAPTKPRCRAGRSRGRCSSLRRPLANISRPTCSAMSSSATISLGKAANWQPWACCRCCQALNRHCRRTCASA